HGGGKRLEQGSEDQKTILAWIRSGAPFGDSNANAPKLTHLTVYPKMAMITRDGRHHLLVTGHFSDGHTEDFTHQVLYTSNDRNVATVDATGVVSAASDGGETAILIRAAGQVASAGVGVIGATIRNYPQVARANFIDDHVFEKLRKFQIIPSSLS